MSDWQVVLKKQIGTVLSIGEDMMNKLTEHLAVELGVENSDELKLIEEKDLEGILKPIQIRKLINSWKLSAEMLLRPDSINNSKNSETITTLESPVLNVSSALGNTNWARNFTIPWNEFPKDLMKDCENGKRPSPTLRREMVRIITRKAMEIEKRPLKKHLSTIAEMVVLKYPKSFEDSCNGVVLGNGYDSLLSQLLARVDNQNRLPGKRKYSGEDENIHNKIRKSTEIRNKYGCENWEPSAYPPLEDEISLEDKKNWLQQHFGEMDLNENEVLQKMNDTYILQRRTINRGSDINKIKEEWPFLFEERFYLHHADTLLGFQAEKEMKNNFANKSKQLFTCLKIKHYHKQDVRILFEKCSQTTSSSEDIMAYKILSSLCIIFQESINTFLIEFGVDAEHREVCEKASITPCIAVFGDPLSASKFSLVVDKQIILEHVQSLSSSILLMFLSYYILNIHYPVNGSATLEFIQRYYMNINPDVGTKIEKKTFETNPVVKSY